MCGCLWVFVGICGRLLFTCSYYTVAQGVMICRQPVGIDHVPTLRKYNGTTTCVCQEKRAAEMSRIMVAITHMIQVLGV